MAMTMHVDVVSAEQVIFAGRAEMVVAAGELGDLGIAPSHAPLITKLVPGPVKVVKQGGTPEYYYISGGILEVQPDVVTILADTAIRAENIDEAKAKEAKANAEKLLSKQGADMDYAAAQAELVRAMAQLRALKQLRDKLKTQG